MSTATHGTIPDLTLGWRLRMSLGDMPVQKMADTLGVNRATIGRWMHDRGARPKRAYLLQWAVATGTDAGWLETGEPTAGPTPGGGLEAGGGPRSTQGYLSGHTHMLTIAA